MMRRFSYLFIALCAVLPHWKMNGAMAQGFSVSPTQRVELAPGNLQYLATKNQFRFAPEQFQIIGTQNDSVGEHNSHWQDLFGWATSGYDNTANDPLAIHFAPWSWICELGAELDYELNQFGYGPSENMRDRSLTGSSVNYDWGHYCTIGDYVPGTWRTLTRQEWHYLLFERPNADQLRAFVSVNHVGGLLLWPDDAEAENLAGNILVADWKRLEAQGCAFLPMAGTRYHRTTADVNRMAGYWTATGHNQASAYFVGIYPGYVALATELYGRHTGRSVRLARNLPLTSEDTHLRYVDAAQFRLINKAYGDATGNLYSRMDTALQATLNPQLWSTMQHSAGVAVRFRTNSTTLAVRYCLLNSFRMSHMAETGISGTDLYTLAEDGRWHYIMTSKPTSDPVQNKVYVSHMDGQMHEYMIYLPLYNGVRWMQIGVDHDALIEQPAVDNPRHDCRIVCFGTSILQGGCASRPGMVATSIMQRDLNAEVVNLAVSGVGRMIMPNAQALAATRGSVDVFVLDALPNSTQPMCDSTYYFVRPILEAHPEASVVMVESSFFTYTHYDTSAATFILEKNQAYKQNFERLQAEYPGRMFYVSGEDLCGPEDEGTVDGIHLTDYGFRAYADKLEKVLKKVLRCK